MNNTIITKSVKAALAAGALAVTLTGCCLFGSRPCSCSCGKPAGECCCRGCCEKPCATTANAGQGAECAPAHGAK